jgi:hypothetical protein
LSGKVSLEVRGEKRLNTTGLTHHERVFENRVLRRIFGPKREEVGGGWRRLHNEELQNLYVSNRGV